jgi:hypothetical protein
MERQTTRPAGSVEFTHDWYRRFLDLVRDAGYEFTCFRDGFGPGDVVLRHDVDLSLDDAVAMARLEAEEGVESTYCVLCSSALYNALEGERRRQIQAIESLGHEVALHFSSHEYWSASEEPDPEALERRIAAERSILDTVVSGTLETLSFHMPPSWALNRTLDEMRNAYAPPYFEDVTYVADSGQRWRESPPIVDDFSPSAQVLTHTGKFFPGLLDKYLQEFRVYFDRTGPWRAGRATWQLRCRLHLRNFHHGHEGIFQSRRFNYQIFQ